MRARAVSPFVLAAALFAGALTVVPGQVGRAQQLLPCDFGSQGDYSGSYAKVSKEGPYEIAEQEIVELESEVDGATIQMGVIRPVVPPGTHVPVIVDASPYYHPLQVMDLRACRPFLTENYVSHGYAVALVAIRGTADSGGCMNMMGPEERADLDQAITHLGTRPWSNGAVGMIGLSYDGATQWEVASFGNPYLKTIVPLSGVPDLFELLYGGGRVDWRGPVVLNGIYYAESVGFYAPGRSPQHTAEVTACPEYAEGTSASTYSGITGELDPHGYWAARRYRDEIVKNYRGSVYLVQGLQDWNVNPGQQFPWIWELEKRGVHVKYLLGQWGHSWPYGGGNRMDWADDLLRWFDRWLKGDESAPLGPKVEVQDNAGEWRRAAQWPSGRKVTFFLDPDNALSRRSAGETQQETVGPDPFHMQGGIENNMTTENLACVPGTCTYFETEAFADDFRIAGLPRLKLTTVPRGPGGQLTAYIYAASDAGMQRLGWAQVDLRFRDGSADPQPVTPGETLEIKFDAQPLDAIVPQGARLYVVISGGSAWNRLPGANFPIDLVEGDGASSIMLMSPRPRERDFFEP